MHPFEQTISVIGPIVGGIIFLTLFFKLIGWISNTSAPNRIKFKGVLDDRTACTVHAAGSMKFEDVRLIGFTDSASAKGPIPYELHGMVILEHSDGRRRMIRAKDIRMIEFTAKVS